MKRTLKASGIGFLVVFLTFCSVSFPALCAPAAAGAAATPAETAGTTGNQVPVYNYGPGYYPAYSPAFYPVFFPGYYPAYAPAAYAPAVQPALQAYPPAGYPLPAVAPALNAQGVTTTSSPQVPVFWLSAPYGYPPYNLLPYYRVNPGAGLPAMGRISARHAIVRFVPEGHRHHNRVATLHRGDWVWIHKLHGKWNFIQSVYSPALWGYVFSNAVCQLDAVGRAP